MSLHCQVMSSTRRCSIDLCSQLPLQNLTFSSTELAQLRGKAAHPQYIRELQHNHNDASREILICVCSRHLLSLKQQFKSSLNQIITAHYCDQCLEIILVSRQNKQPVRIYFLFERQKVLSCWTTWQVRSHASVNGCTLYSLPAQNHKKMIIIVLQVAHGILNSAQHVFKFSLSSSPPGFDTLFIEKTHISVMLEFRACFLLCSCCYSILIEDGLKPLRKLN